jgi:Cu+-exporting ATPase
MSLTTAEGSDTTRLRVILGGIHEANHEYVSERLCEHIDGLLSCQFIDDNNQAELFFNTNHLDQFTLLSAIQRLGYPVQMISPKTVQAELRIGGMHCNSCVSNICSTVLDLPGAIDIQLTFLDKLATVTYDPSILQLDDIITEIEKLSFQVAISNDPQSNRTIDRLTIENDSGVRSIFDFFRVIEFFQNSTLSKSRHIE